jgi:hypothetical protein
MLLKVKARYILSFIVAVVLFAAGCDAFTSDSSGRLRVELTDAPLDDVAEARVVIERLELLADDGEVITISDEDMEFDLLELRNGLTAELADVEVPDGDYSQLRILVDEEAMLVFDDGSEEILKVPSGSQTGIKVLFPSFTINDDTEVVLTIDFDAARSFVQSGGSGKYIFKPVIKPERIVIDGNEEELDEDEVE